MEKIASKKKLKEQKVRSDSSSSSSSTPAKKVAEPEAPKSEDLEYVYHIIEIVVTDKTVPEGFVLFVIYHKELTREQVLTI